MNNLTISIFGNKIFLEIINELKLFPGSKVNLHDSLNFSINNGADNNQIIFLQLLFGILFFPYLG